MNRIFLFDTGPLLAFIRENELHHNWTVEQSRHIHTPALTCEAVLAEAIFLLHREGCDPDALMGLIDEDIFKIAFSAGGQISDLRALMKRYRNMPMSFADACLVRLAELHSNAVVVTFDSHFRIYRKHGNKVIPTLMPN